MERIKILFKNSVFTTVAMLAALASVVRATATQNSRSGGGIAIKAQRLSGIGVIHMAIITTPFLLSPSDSLAPYRKQESITIEMEGSLND